MREAAYSLAASKLDAAAKRWRRLVIRSFVSEDAAFDARRTAPAKPPPRFVHYRSSRRFYEAAGCVNTHCEVRAALM